MISKTTGFIAGRFRRLTATRTRRLVLAAAFAAVAFVAFNAGYFATEFRYQATHADPSPEAPTSPVPAEDALAPDQIRIASVDIQAPVVYEETVDEATFQDDLQHGVVHYPGTALPGRPGNVYVFGHSSDYLWRHNAYAHAFTTLTHVKVGDVIEITDHAGTRYRYEATRTFIVAPTDTRVLDQGDGTESLLTLQTSYPFGTAISRFIVQARLVIKSP